MRECSGGFVLAESGEICPVPSDAGVALMERDLKVALFDPVSFVLLCCDLQIGKLKRVDASMVATACGFHGCET